jgi:hypothetical protein
MKVYTVLYLLVIPESTAGNTTMDRELVQNIHRSKDYIQNRKCETDRPSSQFEQTHCTVTSTKRKHEHKLFPLHRNHLTDAKSQFHQSILLLLLLLLLHTHTHTHTWNWRKHIFNVFAIITFAHKV